MNWMRIRTSWIDFEFGLSEKRPAAVDDDIELCGGRSSHVHSYTTDGPNSVTEREMLPPWSYLIWDQRKTRRELRWKRFNSNSNSSCFLFLFSFLLFSFSLPLSYSSFGDLNKSVSIGSWPQNTTIGKYSLRSMIDSKILVGIVIFF